MTTLGQALIKMVGMTNNHENSSQRSVKSSFRAEHLREHSTASKQLHIRGMPKCKRKTLCVTITEWLFT